MNGLSPITQSMSPEQIVDLFEKRYTCKEYDPARPVTQAEIKAIMQVARLSESSMGLEPWHFLVLENGPITEQMLEHCWGAHAGASHWVVMLGRQPEHFEVGSEYVAHIHTDVQRRDAVKLENRYEAIQKFFFQDLGLDGQNGVRAWVDRQVYIAFGNMMTAAAALGVDATPIEGMTYSEVERVLLEHELFDPTEYHLAALISFGHTSRDLHRPKTRRPMEEVVSWVR